MYKSFYEKEKILTEDDFISYVDDAKKKILIGLFNEIVNTNIEGLKIFEPKVFKDERGKFTKYLIMIFLKKMV